ncbi:MAG: hypothetical protein KDD89_03040, partial [Anaerolineales bacterium]|nr:hypothetical protein [Anaerolineales bacterium]
TFQFHPLLLVGAAIGFGLLLRDEAQRPRAFLLGGTLLIHTAIVATYRAPQAVEYMLPAYVPLVLLMGYGVGDLLRRTQTTRRAPLGVLLAALLLTAGVTQLVSHWPSYRALHHSQDTAVYTDTILSHAPPNSLVLANWHWVTPLWYEQQVNGRRPDLDIVYLFPQTADYSAEWANRIQQELDHGRAVVTTFYDEQSYQTLPPAQPLGEAYLFPSAPLTSLPPSFIPLDLVLGDALRLHGYQLSAPNTEIGQEAQLTVAWEPLAKEATLPLFAHLVGFDGALVAQHDLTAVAQPNGLTLTQFRLTPRWEAQPGDHALLIGLATDPASRTQLATLAVTPMAFAPATQHPTHQQTSPPGTLIGHDWDNTIPNQPRLYLHWQLATGGYWSQVVQPPDGRYTLPQTSGVWGWPRPQTFVNERDRFYVPLGQGIVWFGSRPWLSSLSPLQPNQNVTIAQRFRATRPILRDIGFSVRLLGFAEDNFTWQWRTPDTADSDIPALGGIPTLKWIAGSQIDHPRTLTIDANATPGQTVGGMVRPYDVFTNQPVPLLDGRLATSPQPWLPLVPGTVE